MKEGKKEVREKREEKKCFTGNWTQDLPHGISIAHSSTVEVARIIILT